jgi:hypothetical protein
LNACFFIITIIIPGFTAKACPSPIVLGSTLLPDSPLSNLLSTPTWLS